MTRPQTLTLPAAMLVCLIIAWLGTIAAANLPLKLAGSIPGENQQQASPTNSVTADEKSQSQVGSSEDNGACSLAANLPASILQWCSLIQFYAGDNNLPAGLIAALIWQESGGDPQAYSASGAVGLMQVMPKDGLAASFQCPSGPCFVNRPTIQQLLDPQFNISFGTSMLAGMVNKYGGLREALRHYGPADYGYRYADKVLAIWQKYQ